MSVSDLNFIVTLIIGYGSMSGFASLVSMLVDFLKRLRWIKDGDSQRWSTIFNLTILVSLVTLHFVSPEYGVELINSQAGVAAQVASFGLAMVLQLKVSSAVHESGIKMNSPLSFSYTKYNMQKEAKEQMKLAF